MFFDVVERLEIAAIFGKNSSLLAINDVEEVPLLVSSSEHEILV